MRRGWGFVKVQCPRVFPRGTMMIFRIAVAALLLAPAAAPGAGVEKVAQAGQRINLVGAGAGEAKWFGPAVMNDAGQIALIAQVDPSPREQADEFDALVVRDRGVFRALTRTRDADRGTPGQDPIDIRYPAIAGDGGVICDVELFRRKGGNTDGYLSLWHWHRGKPHRLLTEGEPLSGHDEELYPRSWKAVIANNGIVTVHVQLAPRPDAASYGAIVSFKEGKLQLVEHETSGRSRGRGVKYPHLHAAGDHTVVVRQIDPAKGLNTWELCRLVDGKLEPFAQWGQEAPQGLTIAPGRPTLLGTIGQMRVTAAGRVLLSLRVGHKDNMDIRQALILSEPQFGPFRAVAMWGQDAPGERTYQNLEYYHDRMAASDDGHVVFGDIEKGGSYFYAAMPDGKVQQIATSATLPGLDGEIRSLYRMGIANGGVALITPMPSRGMEHAYAWDPRRGLQPLFHGESAPPGVNGGKGRLLKMDRRQLDYNALTVGGKWPAAWEGPRGSADKGVVILDLSR